MWRTPLTRMAMSWLKSVTKISKCDLLNFFVQKPKFNIWNISYITSHQNSPSKQNDVTTVTNKRPSECFTEIRKIDIRPNYPFHKMVQLYRVIKFLRVMAFRFLLQMLKSRNLSVEKFFFSAKVYLCAVILFQHSHTNMQWRKTSILIYTSTYISQKLIFSRTLVHSNRKKKIVADRHENSLLHTNKFTHQSLWEKSLRNFINLI